MNKPSSLVIIEGSKNVGKTYLINKSGLPTYKFPFAGYFNAFLKNNTDNVGTGDLSTYHFSTSFDVSLLSMAKQGLIKDGLLVDRGFLSNIVLGVSQGRITKEQGFEYLSFLIGEGYINENIKVVYVYRDNMAPRDVPQDQWEYLDAYKLHNLYVEYIAYLNEEGYNNVVEFKNTMDDNAVSEFIKATSTGD